MTDPAIWITESIYVQIGDDYVVVFKSLPHSLSIYHCSLHINDIMKNLRLAIDEDK